MFALSMFALSLFRISNALSPRNPSIAPTSNVLGPVSRLNVVNKYISPDGYNRSATLVNGVHPAPLIKANKGDEFAIQVYNQLTDPTMPLDTSIHWHGLFQNKSNWADGVAYVTQCPLVPGDSFEYKFNITGQSGTYWYHSHYSTQYCDGLRGPLVIYDPDEPLSHLYDVDDENTVITLSDWYHEPSLILGKLYTGIVPNATLINGLGRYPDGPATPLAVVNVSSGLRYRFRVIAASCHPSFNFSIDGHTMTVIEADGNEVDPIEVDSFEIYAGQRYSVVVTANQTAGNYWIRAASSLATGPPFQGNQDMAILRYAGPPDEYPTSTPGPYKVPLEESNLHPLINPAAPGVPEIGAADMSIQLQPGFNGKGFFTLNDVVYTNPTVPVLLQILSGARDASQLLPSGSVYTLPHDKVVEINFPNPLLAPGNPHPVHLHGHAFSVVRTAGSNVTNFVNPIRRDVVSLGDSSTDNVTIRFRTDNSGVWFLHCHIDWHLNLGFAVVMAEAPDITASEESMVAPSEWYTLCDSGNPQRRSPPGLVDYY